MQLSKEGKVKEAAKLLDENATGENLLHMKLACVQLLLSQDERKEAIKVLENLNEKNRSLPGIVSALVTLHMADNNREKASAVLKDAVNYYKKNKVRWDNVANVDVKSLIKLISNFLLLRKFQENTGNLGTLWRQAADFHLRGGEVTVAAASLEELLSASPTDTKTLAQLVIAYAQFDPTRAQLLSKRLPPLDHLSETTDVDALESSNWIIGSKVVKGKVEPSPGY